MNTIAETETTARIAEHARTVAAFLDTIPAGVEPPTHMHIECYLRRPAVKWLPFGNKPDQAARAAAIIRALGGHWDKLPGDLFTYSADRMGVDVGITVDREQVCRKVVTGTREVTKTVPAPDAATVEITETVEDVEWICEPLLAEATA